MSIRATLLFCIFAISSLFAAAVGWQSARGMDEFQRNLVRTFEMELLNEGSVEFLAATRQLHAIYEALPPDQRNADPLHDLAPYLPQEYIERYLFLDSRGQLIGDANVATELSPLLEPGVLDAFWSDAAAGGVRDLSADNFVNYIEGRAEAPAMLHLRAYPEHNIMLGMSRLQEVTDIRLESFAEQSAVAFDSLIRREVGIFVCLILLALTLVGLTLQYLFFSPLSKHMVGMAVDDPVLTSQRLTWASFKDYATRLRRVHEEKSALRATLEREIEARFQAESERDALRSTMERALDNNRRELQKQAEMEMGDAQAALFQRESRLLSKQLLPSLEGALHSMANGSDTAVARDALSRCLVTVRALTESGPTTPLELRETALRSWLEGIASDFEASRSVPVATSIGDDVRARIEPEALRQVVEFVMDNAAAASSEGNAIRLDAVCENGMVEIRVIDRGAGIADEVRPHLFIPFFTLAEDSYGLGLAVTRSVVQRHGGTIEIHTEHEKGTAVIIRIPGSRPASTDS